MTSLAFSEIEKRFASFPVKGFNREFSAVLQRGSGIPGDFEKFALPKKDLVDIISPADADIAQLVEHRLPKPRVAGSNPVVRSIGIRREAEKASLF